MVILRLLIFLAIVLVITVPFNFVTIRSLLRFHPRFRYGIIALAVAGNLMWVGLPVIMRVPSNGLTRVLRALLAPPWFGWFTFTVIYTALVVALSILWLPWRTRLPFTRFARVPSTLFLTLLAIVAAIGVHDALVPLRIERVTIPVEDLPRDLEGTTIAQVSDLHVGLFTRESRLQQIVREISLLAPLAVVMSGDLIDDDPFFVPKLARAFDRLPPATQLVAVLGNHEIYGDPAAFVREMKKTRMKLLVNEGSRLQRGASSLFIAGLSDFAASQRGRNQYEPQIDRALAGRASGEATLVLAHQPKAIHLVGNRDIDLVIVGHTHGGQFGVRSLGWSLAGVFLPYHMGLYDIGGIPMYVNTGTGHWVLPFRFGMTPEITLFTLVKK